MSCARFHPIRPTRFPGIGPTGGSHSRPFSALFVRDRAHEREGAMSRRTLTVDRYQEIERRLAAGRGIREVTRALKSLQHRKMLERVGVCVIAADSVH
jgi:hypothetical protein